jgi:hypothetical protein
MKHGAAECTDVGRRRLIEMADHIFVLGPSGVGKTKVSAHAAKRHNFLHLEIDRFPDGDGIDLEQLRVPWDTYWEECAAGILARELSRRAAAAGRRGCILSFPSGVVFSQQHVEAALGQGIAIRILYGSAADCIAAFIDREASTARGLTVEHWELNNASSYLMFSRPEFGPFRIEAFRAKGQRVHLRTLADRLVEPSSNSTLQPTPNRPT